MSLQDFLSLCRDDPMAYASAHERILAAIGEPKMVDTSKDARLGRVFMNRTVRFYPASAEFYGMEETIERIVAFFRHAAQGLEERKQIIYLLGPVGGGKSSLAERLKALMEEKPIYVLKAGDEMSPVFEHPLGLFRSRRSGANGSERFRHPAAPPHRADEPMCLKRLMNLAAISPNFAWRRSTLAPAPDRGGEKPNRATTTTRMSLRWSARWTSASWKCMRRTIRTPIPIRAA